MKIPLEISGNQLDNLNDTTLTWSLYIIRVNAHILQLQLSSHEINNNQIKTNMLKN